MMPRSPEFDKAVRTGATLVCEAIVSFAGVEVRTLPVIAGSYTIDTTASVRRRASLTLGAANPADIVAPADWQDDYGLWPIGSEIILRCGVQYRNGTQELLDCGVYRLSKPLATKSVDGGVQVTMEAFDRSRFVSRSRSRYGLHVAAGGDLHDFMTLWLGENSPPSLNAATDFGGIIDLGTTDVDVYWSPDDDPWQVLQDMASAHGCEIFFDAHGRPVMQYVKNPHGADVDFTYDEGRDGVLLSAARGLDDETAYSGIVVVGDNPAGEFPYRAEAWDTNPNSPTYYDPAAYWLSRYGRVIYSMSSGNIGSQEQCQTAANLNLHKVGGLMQSATIEGLVHYAQDGGDVLAIEVADLALDAVHVVDSVTMPLDAQTSMQISTRQRAVA